MREFKFRAWDKDFLTMHFFLEKSHNLPTPQPFHKYLELKERFEIMQYVGLKDCKGKEIYEGDILYFEDDCTTEKVYFEYGCFGTMGRYNFISLMDTNLNIAKIIGNIYENPKLL